MGSFLEPFWMDFGKFWLNSFSFLLLTTFFIVYVSCSSIKSDAQLERQSDDVNTVYKRQKCNQTTVKFHGQQHLLRSEYIFHTISIKMYWLKKLRQVNNLTIRSHRNIRSSLCPYVFVPNPKQASKQASKRPNEMTSINDIHRVTSVCVCVWVRIESIKESILITEYTDHLMFSSINNLSIFLWLLCAVAVFIFLV